MTQLIRSRSFRIALACSLLVGGTLTAVMAAGQSEYKLFVTTTDYSTGSSSTMSVDAPYGPNNNVASIHSDAVARLYGNYLYIVNREGGDNIQVLDPYNNYSTVRQFSVGASANPIDIEILSYTKAYVSRNDETDLWIVNPSTGAHTGSIDLSSLADSDGIPEMGHLFRIDDRLFISIQRLDRNNYWTPVSPSYIAVVDVNADTLIDTDPGTPGRQAITLTGTNPYNDIQYRWDTGQLFVSCVGYWGVQDGGVELIDPVTCQTGGYMLTETAAGGDINEVKLRFYSGHKGAVIVTDASFNNVLKTFDPVTGTILKTVYAPGAYVLSDIEYSHTSTLLLADRTPTNPGIRVFEIATDSMLTANPIDVGLPPFDILLHWSGQPTGVEDRVPVVTSLGQNFPNPFNPATTIPFSLDKDMRVTLKIYNASGQLVRSLVNEIRGAGPNQAKWDGRDERARGLPSGIYFARLEAGEYTATRKLLLLK